MKNRVEQLRKGRGLNQDDFAKLLRVSRQTISAIETGKYNPSLELAFAISDVALEWENENKKITARHAGLTKEEMTVPLIIIDTKECKN